MINNEIQAELLEYKIPAYGKVTESITFKGNIDYWKTPLTQKGIQYMDTREIKKLRAIADKLILMANGMSSEQSELGLAIAEEFAPLAEFFIKWDKEIKGITMNNAYFKVSYDEWNKQLNEGKLPQVSNDLYPDGFKNAVGGSENWVSFCEGQRAAEKEYIETLPVSEFLNELDKLKKKYNVELSCGCGCCGGASITDKLGRTFDITDKI